MSDALIHGTDQFDLPAPGADTDFLGTALTPPRGALSMLITVQFAGAAKFRVTESRNATTKTLKMNGDVAFAAGVLYSFQVGCRRESTYNFRMDTGGVAVDTLKVEFVVSA